MKYIPFIIALISLFSCNQPKIKAKKKESTNINAKKEKTNIRVNTTIKTDTLENFIVVLQNPNANKDAKAYIENSGLIWEKLLINEKTLKVAFIKIPTEKSDFWMQRLKSSNVFSTVAIYSEKALTSIKNIAENTFVKLKKGHCRGKCPVYEATFLKDGTILYNGIENVLIKGQKEFKISERQLQELKNVFNNTSFIDYKTSFIDRSVADLPSTFITYKNKQIEIKKWKNVPKELTLAHAFLEEIILEKKCIK